MSVWGVFFPEVFLVCSSLVVHNQTFDSGDVDRNSPFDLELGSYS